jgi:hypothetical protein
MLNQTMQQEPKAQSKRGDNDKNRNNNGPEESDGQHTHKSIKLRARKSDRKEKGNMTREA